MIRKAGDREGWHIKMLLYGASDTGKTYSTSRLSEKYRTLILDVEGGHLSAPTNLPYADFSDVGEIARLPEQYPSGMVKIDTWEQAEGVLTALRRNPDRFEVIVVDSLTELQKRCADFVKSKQTTVIKELDTLTQQGWGSLFEKFRALIRGYRDLKSHVVFTALEQYETDDQVGTTRWMPYLDGKKVPFEVVGWMDIVGHAIKKEVRKSDGTTDVERIFRFISNGREEAKVRGGFLKVEEAPDLIKIFEKVLEVGGRQNGNNEICKSKNNMHEA